MKKSIIISVLSAVVLLTTGCKDFLDLRAEATIPSTGVDYTKQENIFKSVSAAYASLRGCHAFPYISVSEITSDDAEKGSSPADNPTCGELDAFTYTPSNSLINEYWTGFYNVSSAANYAIEEMPKFEEQMNTTALKEYTRQCAAEAKFLRAYAYFTLVRAFGQIPVIDRTMTSEELASQHQKTVAEVYTFIEKDLTEAVSLLPASYSKEWAGRVNKYSAMALKAKVHLYQQEWDSVASLCDRIMASGRFDLMSNFRTEFGMDGENSTESLFEIQSTTLGQSTGEAPYIEYAYVQGPRNNNPSNMQGWGFNVPSQKLIDFLTARGETERMKATLLYRGTKTPEGDSIKMSCANPVYNGKVYTPSSYNKWSYNGYGFDHNIRVIRYSDVLLMFAEAKVNGASTGNTSGYSADAALDKVRARVGLSTVAATLDNIYDERRAEFAMEENRFFDLVRTGRAATVLKSLGFTAGKNEVFPIPNAQRQLNPNLNPTPGYTY